MTRAARADDDRRGLPRPEAPNVLLLMDNVFRFVQAGSELSRLLGRLPSRVGDQPTLATEVAALQERIASVATSDDLHALQCDAALDGFAAENQARMQAMAAAHGQIERRLAGPQAEDVSPSRSAPRRSGVGSRLGRLRRRAVAPACDDG